MSSLPTRVEEAPVGSFHPGLFLCLGLSRSMRSRWLFNNTDYSMRVACQQMRDTLRRRTYVPSLTRRPPAGIAHAEEQLLSNQ